jgi:hypothetical protein
MLLMLMALYSIQWFHILNKLRKEFKEKEPINSYSCI